MGEILAVATTFGVGVLCILGAILLLLVVGCMVRPIPPHRLPHAAPPPPRASDLRLDVSRVTGRSDTEIVQSLLADIPARRRP